MSAQIDIDPADRILAAAVGEPGDRTFYLQARKDDILVSMIMEKQQVSMLASHVDDLLEQVDPDTIEGPDPQDLELEEPIAPIFRVGRIGLGYDGERNMVILQCDEFVGEEDDENEVNEDEDPGRVRVWASPGQMHALARRGEQEVAGGRPLCSMCGEPMDPDGHFCPRSNGHREVTRLS